MCQVLALLSLMVDQNTDKERIACFGCQCEHQVGCLVKDFTPADWMDGKEAKRQGRYTQFAMAATSMALEDAKLDTEAVDQASEALLSLLLLHSA